jgi:hypothetical protein
MTQDEAIAALEAATADRERAREAQVEAGREARRAGVPMHRIAAAMGVTRESAHRILREQAS